MPTPSQPLTFDIPALITWSRTGGRPDPTAARRSKLVGYYTQGARPNHTRMREYHAWKDHVRAHAPPGLLRMRPVDEASRVRVDVVCHFASRTHADPENVRKGIVDALFPQGDKWVYGGHDHPRYDPVRPRVEVTVTLFQGAPLAAPGARPEPAPPPTPSRSPRVQAQTPRPRTATATKADQRPRKVKPSSSTRAEVGVREGRRPRKTPATPPAPQGWWAALEAWAARLVGGTAKRAERSPRRGGKRRG